jgi:hypothetical protein
MANLARFRRRDREAVFGSRRAPGRQKVYFTGTTKCFSLPYLGGNRSNAGTPSGI